MKIIKYHLSLNRTKCQQLLYVGVKLAGCALHQRMNGHCSGVSHNDKLVYQHFQLLGNLPSGMKVQILAKGTQKVWKSQTDKA